MSECDGNNTKYVFHLFDLYVAAVNTVKCHFVETHTNGENIIFFSRHLPYEIWYFYAIVLAA